MPTPEFPRRDGSVVADQRLGRLVQADPRMAAYPLMASQDAPLQPVSRAWHLPYLIDQWYGPTCVGCAVAHALVVGGHQLKRKDAERIYKEAKRWDLWDGESYDGTSVLGGALAAYHLGYVRRFSWARSLDELILGVGHRGPAIMGTWWYERMSTTAVNGAAKPEGRHLGGHAYLIYGVSPAARLFLCANSWGEQYGIQGRFVITFGDMERLLLDRGDACFFDEVAA